jgi:hypothetical protein
MLTVGVATRSLRLERLGIVEPRGAGDVQVHPTAWGRRTYDSTAQRIVIGRRADSNSPTEWHPNRCRAFAYFKPSVRRKSGAAMTGMP